MDWRWITEPLLRNLTTEKIRFVRRFPKKLLSIHNLLERSIAFAFLTVSPDQVEDLGNY
jgi:hypothetical protein